MDMHVRDGGVWKAVKKLWVKDGGTWKQVQKAHVRDGGTWKQFLAYIAASITNQSLADLVLDPADASVTYRLGSDGDVYESNTLGTVSLETWLDGGSSSDFEVRATLNSGTLSSGATGSWLSLSSDREWSVTRTTLGSASAELLIEIRNATTQAVLTSATITLTATVAN